MAGAAPWSVKGINPKAREVAKELARRSGMTLGEWLNRVILEDDVPEEVASEAELPRPLRTPAESRLRLASGGPREESGRVAQALDRLADRIEASETRTGLAISGIEHAVREAVARIEAAEREQLAVAARLDSLSERPEPRGGAEPAGPRSAEALRALYGDEVEIPSSGGADPIETLVTRLGERLAAAEARTTDALSALGTSLAALDDRLRTVESGSTIEFDRRLEALAEDLGRRMHEARAEAAAQLGGAAGRAFDGRFAEMAQHVAAAEGRSARAIDRMGREVLALAEALNRRLQASERQSAALADQVGGEMARLGATLDGRLARAEQVQAEALRRLGEEISRGAERLTDRLVQSERRAAQAIEDIGEQVAHVTERMEHRHERLSDDFAERLRQSEERAGRFLDEARAAVEARLAEAQARLETASAEPAAATVHAFPELLARAEDLPADLEPEPPPPGAMAYDDEDAFAPIADLDDEAFAIVDESEAGEPAERQNLSTREVIERARIAARTAAGAQVSAPTERRRAEWAGRRLLRSLGRRSQFRPASTWQTALLVAGGAAFLSVAAAGVVLMEGPRLAADQEASLDAKSGAPAPRAAVALAPQPPLGAAASEAIGASAQRGRAEAYAAAVGEIEAGEAGGLSRLRQMAASGYGPAQFYLAKLYETGQFGVVKNPAEARRWTQAAAESGERAAMHNLGLYYFRGEGGPQDLAQAAAWFRRAAEAGVVDSQYNLGLLYQSGSGVERDDAEAYEWFSIAAAGGDGQARDNALALEAKLSPAALAAAQKAVQAYRPGADPVAPRPALASGASVAAAQRTLARLGYYRGSVSGAPSSNLKHAVAAYQRDHGLAATGALDSRTLAKLSVFTR